jgi:hypothetical protein
MHHIYQQTIHCSTRKRNDHIQMMDHQIERARQLHVEIQEDHGILPFWPETETLQLITYRHSNEAIDASYREVAELRRKGFGDEAYELLKEFRKDYGRCTSVREETVVKWLEANTPKDEMRNKYHQTKAGHDLQPRAERIYAQMDKEFLDILATVVEILDPLESSEQETEEQIIFQVWSEIGNKLMHIPYRHK